MISGGGGGLTYYYHLQMKFAKVMFLQLSVSHSVHKGGVCLSAWWDTHPQKQTPPGSRHPLGSRQPSGKQTPPQKQTALGSRHPSGKQTPPGGRHPPKVNTPLCSACWEIRATRGQYASYWNAYLFGIIFSHKLHENEKKVLRWRRTSLASHRSATEYNWTNFDFRKRAKFEQCKRHGTLQEEHSLLTSLQITL